MFKFFKNKKADSALQDDGLTEAESSLAFDIAEAAAVFMRSQFEYVALRFPEKKDEFLRAVYPFSFGVLAAALEGKGISWTKMPYVSIHFIKHFMPDIDDPKTHAALILKFGPDPSFKKFVDAGQIAFMSFINSPDDTFQSDALANTLTNSREL